MGREDWAGSEDWAMAYAYRVEADDLTRFLRAVVRAAGGGQATAEAMTRALVEASLRGVDTHGVRLMEAYEKVLADGSMNGDPSQRFERRALCVGHLDNDRGAGHLGGYEAIRRGIEIAKETGMAAISVTGGTHFGAAGAYPLDAAEQGFIALSSCNTDNIVVPFGGTQAFHGTNPIAFGAPVPGQRPYLIDMATSPIPWNRVWQYEAVGRPLPADVVLDRRARPTREAEEAKFLLPFGGPTYGYKGAALGGLVEILCGALAGAAFSHMTLHDGNFAAPQGLGQFHLVMRPDAFLPRADYERGILRYLTDLRAQPAQDGARVMAPGDREWAVAIERGRDGIPLEPPVATLFEGFAEKYGLTPPTALE